METFGLISGLWTSTFALGAFIGPSISGILYDNIGFRSASMFIVGIHLLIGLIVTIFLICTRKQSPYVELKDEKVITTNNGDLLDPNQMHPQQSSFTESMKRCLFIQIYEFIMIHG